MSNQELMKELQEKLSVEFSNYIEELKQLNPDQIIKKSYETTTKESIKYLISDSFYSDDTVKILLKTDNILQIMYDGWMDNDASLSMVFEDTIDEEIDFIVEEYKEEKTKNKSQRKQKER